MPRHLASSVSEAKLHTELLPEALYNLLWSSRSSSNCRCITILTFFNLLPNLKRWVFTALDASGLKRTLTTVPNELLQMFNQLLPKDILTHAAGVGAVDSYSKHIWRQSPRHDVNSSKVTVVQTQGMTTGTIPYTPSKLFENAGDTNHSMVSMEHSTCLYSNEHMP